MTFLHHNDVHVPWYTNGNWTYVKGNLSSIDRDYGFIHNITHSIGTIAITITITITITVDLLQALTRSITFSP